MNMPLKWLAFIAFVAAVYVSIVIAINPNRRERLRQFLSDDESLEYEVQIRRN